MTKTYLELQKAPTVTILAQGETCRVFLFPPGLPSSSLWRNGHPPCFRRCPSPWLRPIPLLRQRRSPIPLLQQCRSPILLLRQCRSPWRHSPPLRPRIPLRHRCQAGGCPMGHPRFPVSLFSLVSLPALLFSLLSLLTLTLCQPPCTNECETWSAVSSASAPSAHRLSLVLWLHGHHLQNLPLRGGTYRRHHSCQCCRGCR